MTLNEGEGVCQRATLPVARDAQTHCFCPRDSEAKRLAERKANRKTPLG